MKFETQCLDINLIYKEGLYSDNWRVKVVVLHACGNNRFAVTFFAADDEAESPWLDLNTCSPMLVS